MRYVSLLLMLALAANASGQVLPRIWSGLSEPVNTVAPVISGDLPVGNVLSCTDGTWTGGTFGFRYQWFANGSAIDGATSATYDTSLRSTGDLVYRRTYTRNAAGEVYANSAVVTLEAAAPAEAPTNVTPPLITGTTSIGSILSCSTGVWTESPTSYAYQWYLNDVAIDGATSSTYFTGNDLATEVITCGVTATNSAGSSTEEISSNSITLTDPSDGLRPEIFGDIPAGATAASKAPLDLSAAVRTDVVGTTRSATINVSGGTFTDAYNMGTANRTYALQDDVVADGKAFEVGASGVTLDGQGHTITFLNVEPEGVVTGTVTEWHGGGAELEHTINVDASAGTYTNTSGNFDYLNMEPGDTVVFSGFANSGNNGSKVVSTITSTVITVSNTSGLVTASGNGDEQAYQYPTLESPTGLTLSSNSHYTFIVQFIDGAEAGNHYEVLANDSTILRLENHCQSSDQTSQIIKWEAGGPAADDTFRIYNPRLTYAIGSGGVRTDVEIINCYIVQGAATYGRGSNIRAGQGCNPILAYNGTGWRVGGVAATWSAGDARGISLISGNTVEFSELTDNGTFVSNRQRTIAALAPGSTNTIQNVRVNNCRQTGINLGSNNLCENFEVFGLSRATNSYGVGTYGGQGNTIRNFNVYMTGEHPIGVALHSNPAQNNELYNFWVEVMTTTTGEEYPWNLARGLSDRWDNGARTLPNHIHDGAFIVHGDGLEIPEGESGGSCVWFASVDDSPGELLEDCFLGAYGTNDGPVHCVDIGSHNENLVVQNNVMESTHNIFWLADTYSSPQTGGRFINNTVTQVGSDPAFATFMLMTDYFTDATFISNNYGTGTAVDDFSGSTDSGNILRFGWLLTVTVTDGGNPVEGAAVVVKDKDTNVLRTGFTTDASGQVVIDVPTYYRQGPTLTTTNTLSPLTVEASFEALSGSNTISPTSDDSISVAIE